MGSLGPPEPTGHRDAAFGLWEREGRLLLVRNPRVVGGGRSSVWDLPGGAVRPGEPLREGLRREWREETGLDARVSDLLLATDGVKRRSAGAPALYTWRAFVFRVEAEGEPRPGAGIDAVAWVTRGEAAARLDAPYHLPLRWWLAGEGVLLEEVEWVDPLPECTGAEAVAPDALRRLLVLAAAAAGGDGDLVAREAAAARAEGVPPDRLAEALLQVVPYAGFPRAIEAFARARPHLDAPAGPAATTAPEDAGPETFARVYGETAARVAEGLGELDPALRAWTLEFAYGRVLARPGLGLLERELLAVSILTALGGLEDPLLGHMRAAVRLGATPDDVAAAVAAVPHRLGETRREAAFALLDRL